MSRALRITISRSRSRGGSTWHTGRRRTGRRISRPAASPLASTPSSASRRAPRHRAARALSLSLGLTLAAISSCGRPAVAFEGKRAFEWLTRQTDMGPRVPGTTAHDSCFAFLVSTLRGFTPHVETDTFTYASPALEKDVRLLNVVARFRPEIEQRVLLGAHWDTRAWADRDPVPAR